MVKSAPEISFSETSLNYGTIDVASSSAAKTVYSIQVHGSSTLYADAINMSVSFKESTNASEARKDSWVRVSTPDENAYVQSVGGNEAYLGSVIAKAASVVVRTLISVNAGAVTAGRIAFFLHHRYQYTG